MKLAKALKTKNRLAGAIAQAVKLIQESNVVEGENKAPHDVNGLVQQMVKDQEALAKLKAQISIANGPISEKIFLMAELKARIAFWRTLPTKDGTFKSEGRYMTASVDQTFHATIKANQVEDLVKDLQARIEKLQDEIDEFNAVTEV